MNGMIFRSFRKRNRPQKNTDTVYSEYSYSGIVPKERVLNVLEENNNGITREVTGEICENTRKIVLKLEVKKTSQVCTEKRHLILDFHITCTSSPPC